MAWVGGDTETGNHESKAGLEEEEVKEGGHYSGSQPECISRQAEERE